MVKNILSCKAKGVSIYYVKSGFGFSDKGCMFSEIWLHLMSSYKLLIGLVFPKYKFCFDGIPSKVTSAAFQIMFKVDLNQIIHRLKLVRNFEYCFPLHSKKGIFKSIFGQYYLFDSMKMVSNLVKMGRSLKLSSLPSFRHEDWGGHNENIRAIFSQRCGPEVCFSLWRTLYVD